MRLFFLRCPIYIYIYLEGQTWVTSATPDSGKLCKIYKIVRLHHKKRNFWDELTIPLQGLLWHWITHKSWYIIKNRWVDCKLQQQTSNVYLQNCVITSYKKKSFLDASTSEKLAGTSVQNTKGTILNKIFHSLSALLAVAVEYPDCIFAEG